MDIPIRMIGVATTIFWIFLIAFSATAAYSVKDLQFNFGDPQMSITPDNQVLFSLPIHLLNRGYYNLGYFNVTTEVSDINGSTVAHGTSFIRTIRKDEAVTVLHNVTLDIDDLMERSQDYLFNDSELNIAESVGLRLAELIPVQASTNFTTPWGAPLYNFMLGEPGFAAFNLTHLRVTVPINFENHAFFDLAGTIHISMYNSANALMGIGQTSIAASQHSPFNGNIELYVATSLVTSSGRLEVDFQTPFFSSGPLVIPYG